MNQDFIHRGGNHTCLWKSSKNAISDICKFSSFLILQFNNRARRSGNSSEEKKRLKLSSCLTSSGRKSSRLS